MFILHELNAFPFQVFLRARPAIQNSFSSHSEKLYEKAKFKESEKVFLTLRNKETKKKCFLQNYVQYNKREVYKTITSYSGTLFPFFEAVQSMQPPVCIVDQIKNCFEQSYLPRHLSFTLRLT